ncbi:hypothetical protein C367_03577 [Cryptococcus neoformans Ze90-1]|nr:hypothetical protein C367_03577 [Cryptococcus neoformans var. grubii Ze90-1]
MRIPHRLNAARRPSHGQPWEKKRGVLDGKELLDTATTMTIDGKEPNALSSTDATGEARGGMANTIIASMTATKEESVSLMPSLINGATSRAITTDGEATNPVNTAETTSHSSASSGRSGSSGAATTSSISSSDRSSIIANPKITANEKNDRSTSSLASAAMSSGSEIVTAAVPVTSLASALHPIQVNTFPSDFPLGTQTTALVASAGRGYVFMPNDAIADSMLLFLTFFFSFLILTIFAIKLDKCLNRRRGGGKEDQVIGEEMRWAEGREVLERKIIWQGRMGGRGKMEYVGGMGKGKEREGWIGGGRVEIGPAFRGREMRQSGMKIQV